MLAFPLIRSVVITIIVVAAVAALGRKSEGQDYDQQKESLFHGVSRVTVLFEAILSLK